MNPWVMLTIALVTAGSTWQVQSWRYEGKLEEMSRAHDQQINSIREQAAAELIQATEEARLLERNHAAKLAAAEREARRREQEHRDAVDRARSESERLRDQLDSIEASLPDLPGDAVVERAVTLGRLFRDCTAEYQFMADKAGRHASDVATLIAAWPTQMTGEK